MKATTSDKEKSLIRYEEFLNEMFKEFKLEMMVKKIESTMDYKLLESILKVDRTICKGLYQHFEGMLLDKW